MAFTHLHMTSQMLIIICVILIIALIFCIMYKYVPSPPPPPVQQPVVINYTQAPGSSISLSPKVSPLPSTIPSKGILPSINNFFNKFSKNSVINTVTKVIAAFGVATFINLPPYYMNFMHTVAGRWVMFFSLAYSVAQNAPLSLSVSLVATLLSSIRFTKPKTI